jgi:spermidine/putrescine transport system permease protein
MALFIIIPLFLTGYYAFTDTDGAFTMAGFSRAFEPMYLSVLLNSIRIAAISTAICLLLGYPVAYILSRPEFAGKSTLFFLFAVPMWMNYLLRTYSWMSILETNGILNSLLAFLRLPKIDILYTDSAVILGMVYNFLPFMILPIHTALAKIDYSLVESAQDLGANPVTVFKRVVLPLSVPGVVSGITMVFMPAVTTFIIPSLLGGGQYMLIGNLIENQFLTAYDWNFGAALSLILMAVIILSMMIVLRVDKDNEGGTLI